MLEDLSGKAINATPFQSNFVLLNRLSPKELADATAALISMINGDEIHTAGWMPGSDWTNTPFQPIYEKAAKKNFDVAAKLFGLLVWDVFLNRPETWITGRFEIGGEEIGSRTYFKKKY